MLPFQMIAGGRYVSTGVPISIPLIPQNPPDFFLVKNITKWGDTTATTVESWWEQSMAAGTGKSLLQTVTTDALATSDVTTNGFTFVDLAAPPTFAPLTGTTISQANPAVAALASTANLYAGDTVRITDSTGMLQIAGYDFTLGTVTANTSVQLAYLDSSGFAAGATAFRLRKFYQSKFYPRYRLITKITQATQAVVTFSVAHDFTVNEYVSFRVGSAFGMSQLNNVQGKVLAVTASTITIDVNTTGMTAFAFPTSAIADSPGVSPALAVPAGSFATNLIAAFDNRTDRFMNLGTSVVGASGSTMMWQAFKYDDYKVSP